jgi:hypothetical protein
MVNDGEQKEGEKKPTSFTAVRVIELKCLTTLPPVWLSKGFGASLEGKVYHINVMWSLPVA